MLKNTAKTIYEYVKNNYKIITAVLFIFCLFYWFSWRPTHIKSICATHSLKVNSNDGGKTFDESGFNATYSLCLHEHGL